MKTNTATPAESPDPIDPSPTTLFAVFAEQRRQHAISYLSHKLGAVALGDLAEYIALAEGEPTRDRYERVLVSLVHAHIPQLIDAELVRYDAESETVELRPDPAVVRPYLDLAAIPTPE